MSVSNLIKQNNKSWLNIKCNALESNETILGSIATNVIIRNTNNPIVIDPGTGAGLHLKISGDLELKNSPTGIPTSILNVYSQNEIPITFIGPPVNNLGSSIRYTRIGRIVIIECPYLTFTKNNGPAGPITSIVLPTALWPSTYAASVTIDILDEGAGIPEDIGTAEVGVGGAIRLSKRYNSSFGQAVAPNTVQIKPFTIVYTTDN